MLPVHVGRAALAANLVRHLKNLTFPICRKRNLPPRIGILQGTVGDWTSKRILNQNVIRHELGHVSGMRSGPGTRAGFELEPGLRPSRSGSPGAQLGGDGVAQRPLKVLAAGVVINQKPGWQAASAPTAPQVVQVYFKFEFGRIWREGATCIPTPAPTSSLIGATWSRNTHFIPKTYRSKLALLGLLC
jgi:hypothetical protein